MDTQKERACEIRVALVLYGGVSLAVYENGVSRCFYDLVRRRGVFDIVLELLDASAVVDVVTGTSAGGINGLFLAAALESGTEFALSADLWRRLADLGELFREPKRTADIESLFDGEYFHQELIKAFEELCQVANPTYESPGEMDVFITGTDLDGHRRRYLDSLGAEIDDKEHRVVFHLEHRPGRKSLGVSEAKTRVDPKKQAAILGTLARITASFPLGFPPVQGSALDAAVQQALNETSKILPTDESMFVEGRSFVDGGVLDNKPFGPALRAIFYRMPAGVVDRRLFYVEPDPVPFAGVPKKEHSPIAVGIAALTAIPGHEGIAEDLEQLLTHNQRVRWLAHLKDTLLQGLGQNAGGAAPPSSTYLQTRIDCVARSLVVSSDAVPSAGDYPKDATRVILLEGIRGKLRTRIENNLGNLDPFDVVFHLRRAFHLLYDFYDDLESGATRPHIQTAMRMTGRLIKVLKIILDRMVVLRDLLVAETESRSSGETAPERILDGFVGFLSSAQPHWAALNPYFAEPIVDLARFEERWREFFRSEDLSRLAKDIREARPANGGPSANGTILDRLAVVARQIVVACDGHEKRFRDFDALDQELYPLEFTSGVYELDEVEFVRISPADAQVGLSKGDPYAKITGDELGHFSAFLRRDWRSNDILQGRFDGICQIIRSLLGDRALEGILSRAVSLSDSLTPERLAKSLPHCSASRRQALWESWQALTQEGKQRPTSDRSTDEVREAGRAFREQLICAGQEDAFYEDLQTIYADLHYQEIKFGRALGPRGTQAGTNEALIEADARLAAQQDLANLTPDQQWKAFRAMRIGSQDIVGPKGQVPNNVVGEYVTMGYLMLWGMLRRSLGNRAGSLLDRQRVRWFFRDPVVFLHRVLSLARRERTTAVGLVALGVGGLLGLAGTALYYGKWGLGVPAAIALIGLMALFTWVRGMSPRR